MAPDLAIRLRRSVIGEPREARRTIRALGLRRVNDVVVQPDRPSVRGMIGRVRHLVEVEAVERREDEAAGPSFEAVKS